MRIPKLLIPAIVIVALLGGYFLRLIFTQPTTATTFDSSAGAKATFIVDGVKCKTTAAFFSALYDSVPGIIGIETFASEHKAIFTYDPDRITRDSIRAIMEAPIPFDDGTSEQIFKCLSVE
ncbi:hypothetical protein C3F09_09210 [candidate division GN15 bacterium]|uniref:HMA domain-containing protein n=1 Tax=candidate division GN15 bacterium TaxID=2072418 RepID=A0A855WY21_9BACT|nr:MAG: hypothetical protein C3F09_09210 [candidate division GN15 bacterium]